MGQAKQIREKTVNEVRLVSVDYTDKLDAGKTLTTPTATVVGSTAITVSSVAVSTAELTIDGVEVAAGKAVQYKVSAGGTAGQLVNVRVTVNDTSTPAQTFKDKFPLRIIAD